MSIEYRIDPEQRRITTTASGRLTAVEVAETRARLAVDPAFDRSFDHLFDMSEVSDLEVPSTAVRDLAANSIFAPTARRAVVAPKDSLFGLSRMYEGYRGTEDVTVRAFRSLSAALAWLDGKD